MNDALATRLRDLLEEERSLLSRGGLEGLEDLLLRKEALAAEMEHVQLSCSAETAERLAALALHNGRLLEAARKGIRTAMDRVAECTRVKQSLDTYDQSGHRRRLASTGSTLQRRA